MAAVVHSRALTPLTSTVACLVALGALSASVPAQGPPAVSPTGIPASVAREEWIQLFNGQNLEGWTPKFATRELGENYRDTFRVENGLLQVRYDRWTSFAGEFGHLFYARPFSHYVLAAEYRFVGDQVSGAPSWAIRNNGLMLHSPAPQTMTRAQDFPISLEIQLLGGLGDGKTRTTANLCTPGSHVVLNGKLHTAHCTNSASPTFNGDDWVRVEVLVHGDELVRHVVNGQIVLEYSKPQIGGGGATSADPAVKVDGTPMTGGYISIQAETAPADFRRLELLNLEGCMDPKSPRFRPYFVKSDPAACR
jgi:hypothetical protein